MIALQIRYYIDRWTDLLGSDNSSFAYLIDPGLDRPEALTIRVASIDPYHGDGTEYVQSLMREGDRISLYGTLMNDVSHIKITCPFSSVYDIDSIRIDSRKPTNFMRLRDTGNKVERTWALSGDIHAGSFSWTTDYYSSNTFGGGTMFWGPEGQRYEIYRSKNGVLSRREGKWVSTWYKTRDFTVTSKTLHIDDIEPIIREVQRRTPEMPSPSGLLRQCCDENQFCGNNIANCIEAVGLVRDAIEFAKQPTKAFSEFVREASKKGWKNLSKAWLTYRYQYKTTLADYQEAYRCIDTLDKKLPNPSDWDEMFEQDYDMRIMRAGDTKGNCTVHMMCGVRAKMPASTDMTFNVMLNHIRRSVLKLREYGLNPSLTNLWDLVPLSFVIDWFMPIGDWCEKFDEKWYLREYSFSPGIVSTKIVDDYLYDELFPLTVSIYNRECGVLVVPKADDYTPSGKVQAKRIIDGVSMLVG